MQVCCQRSLAQELSPASVLMPCCLKHAVCRSPTPAAAATAHQHVLLCMLCWRAATQRAAAWSLSSGSSWQVGASVSLHSCSSTSAVLPYLSAIVQLCRSWRRYRQNPWLIQVVFFDVSAVGVSTAAAAWGSKWVQLLDWEESGGRARRCEVWALTGEHHAPPLCPSHVSIAGLHFVNIMHGHCDLHNASVDLASTSASSSELPC